MAESTTLPGAAVARRLLDAIVSSRLRWLQCDPRRRRMDARAVPREIVETHSAADTTETFRGWLAPHHALEVRSTEQHTVEGREILAYNLVVRPDWAPDVWHMVEQSAYCRS